MAVAKIVVMIAIACVALPALASPEADALGVCFSDNTSGKDRKDLAKWIFVAMSSHPEIKFMASASDKEREQINQTVGTLVTKLLAESCVQQARAARQAGGYETFKTAFASLGQLAMQELMANKDVQVAISGFEKFLDKPRLESALASK